MGKEKLPEWLGSHEYDFYGILASLEDENEIRKFLQFAMASHEIDYAACRVRAALLMSLDYKNTQIRNLSTHNPVISRNVISNVRKLYNQQSNEITDFVQRYKRRVSQEQETDE